MIYLDNAATSFPKPPQVIEEQSRCLKEYCGNPGRGSHRLAMRASEAIYSCREAVADLFGSPRPERVIFTMNATASLNYAIKGLLREGDHVLISDMEHNAVFRPIYKLAREGRVTFDVFPTYPTMGRGRTERVCAAVERMIRPDTRMLICVHASNLCSAVAPIEEIGEICRRRGVLFVVDAAQSAGHLPIDLGRMKIDALCAPGHKGLLGVQGTGILLLGDDVTADTLMEGGSGYNSLEGEMPEDAPERYEAGTLPTPAIVGLRAGIAEVRRRTVKRIGETESDLCRRLKDRLERIGGVRLFAPEAEGGIVLFHAEGIPSDEMGRELDRLGFCVRTGFHCCALGHATLGTPPDGAVRVSPGIYNTPDEMDAFADAVERIAKGKR